MNIVRRVSLGVLALAPLLAGCAIGASSQSPQSHFAFPNSNVIPIGHSEGSTSKLCGILFVQWGSPDGDDQDEATREALEKANGDLLINVRTDSRVFMVPMLFAICTTNVSGTAAKMEVGRQQLGAMNNAAPPVSQPAAKTAGCASDADCKAGRVCREGSCTSP